MEHVAAAVRKVPETFDVPVDLLLTVQVVQPSEDLSHDGGYVGLRQGPRPQLHTHTHIVYTHIYTHHKNTG